MKVGRPSRSALVFLVELVFLPLPFETTEGKGYFGRTHILTDQSLAVVLDYCFHRWGVVLRPWYGDGYYEAWHLSERTRSVDAALKDKGTKDEWLWKPVDVIFLSNKPLDIEDFPARVWIWPRSKKEATT